MWIYINIDMKIQRVVTITSVGSKINGTLTQK